MCPRSRRLRIQHRSSISTAWTWRGRRNLRHANLVGILGQRSFSPPAIPPTTNCAKLHHPIAERRAAKLQRCNRPTHFRTLALCVRSETPTLEAALAHVLRGALLSRKDGCGRNYRGLLDRLQFTIVLRAGGWTIFSKFASWPNFRGLLSEKTPLAVRPNP